MACMPRLVGLSVCSLLLVAFPSHQHSTENSNSPILPGIDDNATSTTPASTTASGAVNPPTAQLAKPPSSNEEITTAMATTSAGLADDRQKAPIVTRQSPMAAAPSQVDSTSPFAQLKPESKDEMFARIDMDGDNAITLQDYMNRDRYYVESVRTEFNDIDANRDGTVTKAEFDAFVRRLDEQRKAAMLNASNFTLQKNDANKDGELSMDEIGAYINGTLQRSVVQLPEVFRQFDRDGNQRLDLNEFHELDFNFPWEKFPPVPNMEQSRHQVFFAANGPMRAQQQQPAAGEPMPPSPFADEQAAGTGMPTMLAGAGAGTDPSGAVSHIQQPGAYGSMPVPQPVAMVAMKHRFYRRAESAT